MPDNAGAIVLLPKREPLDARPTFLPHRKAMGVKKPATRYLGAGENSNRELEETNPI
jgi:hypothetical protein